jgi:alkylhydroperoxidase family enzyme
MSDITKLRHVALARLLDGSGKTAPQLRHAAFANEGVTPALRMLVDKTVRHAYKVIDEDFAAAKAAGATEDELFELVVCAAVGQATRQLDAALEALAKCD